MFKTPTDGVRVVKTCGTCLIALPLDRFSADKARLDGLTSRCRECQRAYQHDYYLQNKAAARRRGAAAAKAHPEMARERWRRYKRNNLASVRKRAAESRRRRYWADPETGRAKSRAANKRDYVEHHARCLLRAKRARLNRIARDPEGARLNVRTKAARRRARIRGVRSERVDYDRIKARDRMRCHICKRKVQPSDLQFDHVIPVAAGGDHVESNIAVSHAKCNLTKSAKVLTLF